MQRDLGPPPRFWVLWSPLFLTALISIVTVHHHQLRNVCTSLISATQAVILARMVWRPVPYLDGMRSRILLVGGSMALVVMLALRVVMLALPGDGDWAMGIPVEIQVYSYLFALMILLLNTVGFLLMQKERAIEIQRVQANQDALTGIYNRRALMSELRRIIDLAVLRRESLSMLMLDIDHFKRVNDTHGHQVGDEVIGVICQRVKARLRRGDLFARFGGEEFVVVLPGTKLGDAHTVAEAIRGVIAAEPIQVGEIRIPVTISIGIQSVQSVTNTTSVDELIAACDAALYRAKQNGRNRVECFVA